MNIQANIENLSIRGKEVQSLAQDYQNEVTKILLKKKLLLISGILLVLISVFAYGENYKYNNI